MMSPLIDWPRTDEWQVTVVRCDDCSDGLIPVGPGPGGSVDCDPCERCDRQGWFIPHCAVCNLPVDGLDRVGPHRLPACRGCALDWGADQAEDVLAGDAA